MAVGIGFDIHPLKRGRKLILGGVPIDFPLGLDGHSDGDAVLHAVTDALLGATGKGDIGDWFPSDDRFRGADSRDLLRKVRRQALRGWKVENADVNVLASRPVLGALKLAIRQSIARLLGIPASRVSVKGKTARGLGDVGKGKAIAAQAVVELRRR